MRPFRLSAVIACAVPLAVGAQQPRPAIRPLGPVVATSRDTLALPMAVRHVAGGGVLVNDVGRRRVLHLDSTLALREVVVDSTTGAANAYGPRPGGLLRYRGDSTLFVDAASLSMLVIDGAGKIARVASVPRSDDAIALTIPTFGVPALDAKGRLVYRGSNHFRMVGGTGAARTPGEVPQMPDTSPLVAVDLATRKVDTVAWVKIPRPNMQITRDADGNVSVRSVSNPLPVVDDWAVTSDGRLAVVRGRDYRVEITGADGAPQASAKVPFDWKRMSDEEKAAFIDSVKAARARMGADAPRPMTMTGTAPAPGAAAGGPMVRSQTMIIEGGPGGGGPGGTVVRGSAEVEFVQPGELPDYRPAFFAGSVRADEDGNLWIRTTSPVPAGGGAVYDVVNGKGELVDRVQVPAGRTILGFAPGGVVFLTSRQGTTAVLERARLR